MEIEITKEAGLEEALIGMKFSFQSECCLDSIATFQNVDGIFEKYLETAKKLCKRDEGHNKFLEQMQVWMIIRAPLYWWKQFDTYRVGTSKLSKSTMHTLMKKSLEPEDFEGGFPDYDDSILIALLKYQREGDFDNLNKNLPQSFLQTRMVNTNYKVLRNTIQQRKGHKLPEWEMFIKTMFENLENPDLLGIKYPFNFAILDNSKGGISD